VGVVGAIGPDAGPPGDDAKGGADAAPTDADDGAIPGAIAPPEAAATGLAEGAGAAVADVTVEDVCGFADDSGAAGALAGPTPGRGAKGADGADAPPAGRVGIPEARGATNGGAPPPPPGRTKGGAAERGGALGAEAPTGIDEDPSGVGRGVAAGVGAATAGGADAAGGVARMPGIWVAAGGAALGARTASFAPDAIDCGDTAGADGIDIAPAGCTGAGVTEVGAAAATGAGRVSPAPDGTAAEGTDADGAATGVGVRGAGFAPGCDATWSLAGRAGA
jgi:hypothetical protein